MRSQSNEDEAHEIPSMDSSYVFRESENEEDEVESGSDGVNEEGISPFDSKSFASSRPSTTITREAPSFLQIGARKVRTSKKGSVSIRIGISCIMIFQIAFAVGINWTVLSIFSQSSISELGFHLRKQLIEQVSETTQFFLDNATTCGTLSQISFRYDELDPDDYEAIRKHFWTQINAFPLLTHVYFGKEDGSYIGYGRIDKRQVTLVTHIDPTSGIRYQFPVDENGMRIPGADPIRSAPYNSTDRPWYQETEAAGEVIWTEIYEFALESEYGVTAGLPVYNRNGTLVGVLGVDFYLSFISNYLSLQTYGKSGFAFVIENNFNLVSTSRGQASETTSTGLKRLACDSHLADPHVVQTCRELRVKIPENERDFSFSSSDGTLMVSWIPVQIASSTWNMVVVVPRGDWFTQVDRSNYIVLGICLGLLLLSILFAVLLTSFITRPLKRVAKGMRAITETLDLGQEASGRSRLREISSLQRSFDSMQIALRSFMRYVPLDIVRMLLQYKAEAVCGVEAKHVGLFFSDIADFTTISENIEPQLLINLLAGYLAEMTNLILDSQGTLADYIGDAIFAFWGAPHDVKDPEIALCETALRQQERLKELNASWIEQGLKPIQVRMGLHSGRAVCGNIGSELRMKYTAIGDAVNLASRLENLNKMYGTFIMMSEEVYMKVKDSYACRALDLVAVKGRVNSTRVYELVGRLSEVTEAQKSFCNHSHVALEQYLKKQFQECLGTLQVMENEYRADFALVKLRERCQRLLMTPPPRRWTGVEMMTEK